MVVVLSLLLKQKQYDCENVSSSIELLVRRADGTKLNGLATAAAASTVNRTAGGLIELARSEFDEAILA